MKHGLLFQKLRKLRFADRLPWVANFAMPAVTAGIGVWLHGVGQTGMYDTYSGTNEWKDETSQMPGGHFSQQSYEDRSTLKIGSRGQNTKCVAIS